MTSLWHCSTFSTFQLWFVPHKISHLHEVILKRPSLPTTPPVQHTNLWTKRSRDSATIVSVASLLQIWQAALNPPPWRVSKSSLARQAQHCAPGHTAEVRYHWSQGTVPLAHATWTTGKKDVLQHRSCQRVELNKADTHTPTDACVCARTHTHATTGLPGNAQLFFFTPELPIYISWQIKGHRSLEHRSFHN